SERVLRWEALLNARDLDGLPTVHGPIRPGAIVRSDALFRLTSAGQAALVAHGVRTVIDMRTPGGVAARPDPLLGTSGVVHAHIALQSEAMWRSIAPGTDRVTFDTTMLALAASRFAAVAEAIADAPMGGVLIHCEAGKDRTGLIVILLLDLVGTPADAIAADYTLTAVGLTGLYAELVADPANFDRRARLEEEARCRPEVALAIVDTLHRRHGGAEAYLRAGGASDASIERIRGRMLDQRSTA
ncbi:MAG: tyrosine-protein phosphatase, partial [Chloroflexota bacterium]